MQTTQLFSTDGTVFLYIISNGQYSIYGDLILYNTARYNQYGALAEGAMIWHSATLGTAAQQPFQLTMQEVRAPSPNCPSLEALGSSGVARPMAEPCTDMSPG